MFFIVYKLPSKALVVIVHSPLFTTQKIKTKRTSLVHCQEVSIQGTFFTMPINWVVTCVLVTFSDYKIFLLFSPKSLNYTAESNKL